MSKIEIKTAANAIATVEDDGYEFRTHTTTFLPDAWLDHLRSSTAYGSRAPLGTQNHLQHLMEVPEELYHERVIAPNPMRDPDLHKALLRRLLNDPDLRVFRVGGGRA